MWHFDSTTLIQRLYKEMYEQEKFTTKNVRITEEGID
jgi:hypothetical protein